MRRDIAAARGDFPFFTSCDSPVFLDTAASAQKPDCVLDAVYDVYAFNYANIHRGSYGLSDELTNRFESVRSIAADFIGASSANEIVFTRSATESINLVASSYGDSFISAGSEVVISDLEHHSNIIPWQLLCDRVGAELRVCKHDEMIFDENTALVAVTHMSNVLGNILSVESLVRDAHSVGAKVLVDACQSVVHLPIDVTQIDSDFLVFSSHKLYGPCGVGILHAKYDILNSMPPYQTGGGMISGWDHDRLSFYDPPTRFEAGTQPIAEVIGFGEALKYLSSFDRESLIEYEKDLYSGLVGELREFSGVHILCGNEEEESAALVSFTCDWASASDIGILLNEMGIAVRTGHHCARPLLESLGVENVARVSLGLYNNKQDVESFLRAFFKIKKLLG